MRVSLNRHAITFSHAFTFSHAPTLADHSLADHSLAPHSLAPHSRPLAPLVRHPSAPSPYHSTSPGGF
jgi:hypothetical protein